jgi:hypothetical protein
MRWQDVLVALVHHVRHGLADQMVTDGPHAEPVRFE